MWRVSKDCNKEAFASAARVTIDGKKTKPATYEILKEWMSKRTVR